MHYSNKHRWLILLVLVPVLWLAFPTSGFSYIVPTQDGSDWGITYMRWNGEFENKAEDSNDTTVIRQRAMGIHMKLLEFDGFTSSIHGYGTQSFSSDTEFTNGYGGGASFAMRLGGAQNTSLWFIGAGNYNSQVNNDDDPDTDFVKMQINLEGRAGFRLQYNIPNNYYREVQPTIPVWLGLDYNYKNVVFERVTGEELTYQLHNTGITGNFGTRISFAPIYGLHFETQLGEDQYSMFTSMYFSF